jgi:hypothetical protein
MAKVENVAYKRSQRTFFGREVFPIDKSGLGFSNETQGETPRGARRR